MKNLDKLIISISGRITVFLYLFTLMPLMLYVMGNFQGFLDDSLMNLLIIYNFSTLFFASFGTAYIIIIIIFARNTERRIGIRIALVIAGILTSAAAYLISKIIITGLQPV